MRFFLDSFAMTSVLHLRKQLIDPPVAVAAGVRVRTIAIPDDIDAWLALRERAMADLVPTVRQWGHHDFLAEMVWQPWWRAEWTWLAFDELHIVGAGTLAVREGRDSRVPVIHWLLVDPTWRRRGIGRVLVSHLERAAWHAGWREVQLETHAGWAEAVAFYHSIGYAPLPRKRSPR
jgi:GNAT superfamily N-acetyltransferase